MIYDAAANANPAVGGSATLSKVDGKSPSGTALKVLRTSPYDNITLKFSGNFATVAQDSVGIKVWVAGDTNAALLSSQYGGISFGFKSGNQYYSDTNWGQCAADITPTGTWYTFYWTDRQLAKMNYTNGRLTGSAARTVDASSILAGLQEIYITLGWTQSGVFTSYNNTAIYIDDLQFI